MKLTPVRITARGDKTKDRTARRDARPADATTPPAKHQHSTSALLHTFTSHILTSGQPQVRAQAAPGTPSLRPERHHPRPGPRPPSSTPNPFALSTRSKAEHFIASLDCTHSSDECWSLRRAPATALEVRDVPALRSRGVRRGRRGARAGVLGAGIRACELGHQSQAQSGVRSAGVAGGAFLRVQMTEIV